MCLFPWYRIGIDIPTFGCPGCRTTGENSSSTAKISQNSQFMETFVVEVAETQDRMRLDSFLVTQYSQFSRAKIQRAIIKGLVKVDGSVQKASFKLNVGQVVSFLPPAPESDSPIPENIPLDIVFEDEHIIGINKPPRMVVHPAKGHWSGTLTAALAFHFKSLSSIGGDVRPGIVHRLDRDTSGIIVIAKHDEAHSKLAIQFEHRFVKKFYTAIVAPPPDRDRDKIDQPIGVHPYQREKMAIRRDHKTSRSASTFYEVIERIGRFARVSIQPKTGRTHQIRVHLAHIGSPVIADKLYSGRSSLRRRDIEAVSDSNETVLDRQALHAERIEFQHPVTDRPMHLIAPYPNDMRNAWDVIEKNSI